MFDYRKIEDGSGREEVGGHLGEPLAGDASAVDDVGHFALLERVALGGGGVVSEEEAGNDLVPFELVVCQVRWRLLQTVQHERPAASTHNAAQLHRTPHASKDKRLAR